MVIERRALAARETDHERLWLALALAGALVLLFGWLAGHRELPRLLCPFRALTGIPCVTCGGTRALRALAHGDLIAAFGWNPLVALAGAAGLAYLAYAAIVVVLRAPRLRVTLTDPDRRAWRAAAATVLLANWWFLIVHGR